MVGSFESIPIPAGWNCIVFLFHYLCLLCIGKHHQPKERVVTKNSSICGAPLARQKKNCNRKYGVDMFDVQTNPGKRSCRKRFLRIPGSAREVAPFGMPNKMVSRIQRQGRLELLLTPFRTNKP